MNQKDKFVNDIGFFFEKYTSYPRIAGKIFGILMISDHKSAKEIIDELEIAKSSSSSMINLLIKSKLVEEIHLPKERSRYYKLKENAWESILLETIQGLLAAKNLFADNTELLKDKKSVTAPISELNNIFEYLKTKKHDH